MTEAKIAPTLAEMVANPGRVWRDAPGRTVAGHLQLGPLALAIEPATIGYRADLIFADGRTHHPLAFGPTPEETERDGLVVAREHLMRALAVIDTALAGPTDVSDARAVVFYCIPKTCTVGNADVLGKLATILVIRKTLGLGLVEAKNAIDAGRVECDTLEQATALAASLEAIGCNVSVVRER